MNRFLLCLVFAGAAVSAAAATPDPLDSKDDIVRRREFRRRLAADRAEALRIGTEHSDPVLRSRALLELFRDRGETALPLLDRAAADPDYRVRMTVLGCLKALPDSPARRAAAAKLQRSSGAPELAAAAGQLAFPFRFHRVKPRLSERPDWDYAITKVASVEVPSTGWKFRTDPEGKLHESGCFAPDFDDRAWRTIGVGLWEEQGFPNYDGYAWYRIAFTAPEKPACNAAELNFGGVDEEAWVWLNGVYVGQHAVGASGWDKPFQLDVTDEVRWGKVNLLVVRVYDRRFGGGIWKPIRLDVLR